MELTGLAASALERLRQEGRELRYEVTEVCRSGRYRLSVRYSGPDEREVRLGLLYSEDHEALESLRARLSGG